MTCGYPNIAPSARRLWLANALGALGHLTRDSPQTRPFPAPTSVPHVIIGVHAAGGPSAIGCALEGGAMNHRHPFGSTTLLLVLGPVHAVSAQSGRSLQTTTLDNGLEVLVVENHSAPLATVLVAVRNGAFTQEPGDEGLAHLYEHLLFRSYGGDPSDFAVRASRLNAAYNGATADEVVTYYMTLPSEKTKDAIELLARLVSRARFEEDDLDEERPVVLDELERAAADPEQVLERQMLQHLWGDGWHRKDIGGDSASLSQLTLERLRATYERYYVPNNAALIVTGDVDPSKVFEEAEKRFRGWKAGPDPHSASLDPMPALTGSRAIVMGHDVADVKVVIKLRGPSFRADTAATLSADLLFQLLNDPTSTFQIRLVENGPFVWVSGDYDTRNDVGPISIEGSTTHERAEEAILALIGELDLLSKFMLMDVTDDDLAIAKKRREVEAVLATEIVAVLAPTLASGWATGRIDVDRSDFEGTNEQTLADLRQFADRYLVDRPKVIGVLGPPDVIARVGEWLGTSVRKQP